MPSHANSNDGISQKPSRESRAGHLPKVLGSTSNVRVHGDVDIPSLGSQQRRLISLGDSSPSRGRFVRQAPLAPGALWRLPVSQTHAVHRDTSREVDVRSEGVQAELPRRHSARIEADGVPVGDLDHYIDRLLTDVLERDAQIAELQSELSQGQSGGERRSKGQEAEAGGGALEVLQKVQADVLERDSQIAELQNKVECREVELEKAHEMLKGREIAVQKLEQAMSQLIASEKDARAATAAAMEQIVSLQLARSDDEAGQKEDLRNLQTQLRQAVAVVKALNERLTEQLSVTNDIEAKKAQAETRIQELEDQYLDHRREADTFRRQTALLQKELAKEIATRRSAQKSVLQLQAQIIASQEEAQIKLDSQQKSAELSAKQAAQQIHDLKQEQLVLQMQNTDLRKKLGELGAVTLEEESTQTVNGPGEGICSGLLRHAKDSSSQVDQIPPSGFRHCDTCRCLEEAQEAAEAAAALAAATGVPLGTNMEGLLLPKKPPKKEFRSFGVQTNVTEGNRKSVEELFWHGTLQAAEKEVAAMQQGGKKIKFFSDAGILTVINNVYCEKAIADHADKESKKSLQPLSSFLWMWMLTEHRTRDKAKDEMHKFLTNLLVRVRGKDVRKVVFTMGARDPMLARMMLFARFLGLWVTDPLDSSVSLQGIAIGGLNLFLTMLLRCREGASPLLAPSVQVYKVQIDELNSAVDSFLTEVKLHEREGIKTSIAQINGNEDLIDLELSLEIVVQVWADIDSRLTSRLQALFVAHDANGDGDLDQFEFHDMMRKLDQEQHLSEALQQRRIFSKMCIYNRVDSGVFCRSARCVFCLQVYVHACTCFRDVRYNRQLHVQTMHVTYLQRVWHRLLSNGQGEHFDG